MKIFSGIDSPIPPFFLAMFLFCVAWPFSAAYCHAMGSAYQVRPPDAVNLIVKKRYQLNPDGSYSLTLYFKTLINTYKGKKDRGDFRFGYNSAYEKVDVKFARTILPDGKIVEVSPKEINDIADPSTQGASIFSGARLRIVNFPVIEKGCKIELEIVKHARIGLWGLESFRLADPCRQKTVVIDLPEGSYFDYHLKDRHIHFATEMQQGRRILTWTGKDLDKAPKEPFSPPVENMASTLIFSTFGSWQQVATWFDRIFSRADTQAGLGRILKALSLSGSADEIYSKLTKRLEILPISFFDTKLVFQSPRQTLMSGYGSQIDVALLFYQILKTKGLAPHLIMASSRGIWVKDIKSCPYPLYLDTLLVKTGHRFYSFDVKDLSPGITGMDGQLGLDLATGKFVPIVDVRPTRNVSSYEVDCNDSSILYYHFKTVRSGRDAQGTRKMFRDLTPKEFKVTSSIFFHSLNPLAVPLAPLEISNLDPLAGPVSLRANFKVKDFIITCGDFWILPVQRISVLDTVATCPENRKNPLFFRKGDSSIVKFIVRFPHPYRIAAIPKDQRGQIGPMSWENFCKASDSRLDCVRKVEIRRGFVKNGKEFKRLKKVISNLLDPEENSLRLFIGP